MSAPEERQVNKNRKQEERHKTTTQKIPNNENSRRAFSRKNRVYVFREFLLETYCLQKDDNLVLDVAGGKGDLSWLLQNVDGIPSIVLDPCFRTTTNLVRSVHWLQQHPEEAQRRANPTMESSYQPLAALFLDQIMSGTKLLHFQEPRHLTLSMNDTLVQAVLQHVLLANNHQLETNQNWKDYFQQELEKHIGIFLPPDLSVKDNNRTTSFQQQVMDAQEAIQVFQNIQLIVGFHPDQATECCLDLALCVLKIPVCIVPCCVFPSEFTHRRYQSQPVQTYSQLIAYLQHKYPILRSAVLSFPNTTTSRNIVLYTLPQDVPNYPHSKER